MTALSTTLTDTLEKAGVGSELMQALEAEFKKMRIPTGFITGWRGKTPPEGWLAVNGQEVYQSVYPELYAFLKAQPNARTGTDDTGPYVLCDMPHHRVIELTTDPNEVGQLVEAGLPDINGTLVFGRVPGVEVSDVTGTGLVSSVTHADNKKHGLSVKPDGNYGGVRVGLSAKNANALFGKSSTFQTDSLRMLAIIKI